MKLKQIIKIIMILLIAVSAAGLAALFIMPPELIMAESTAVSNTSPAAANEDAEETFTQTEQNETVTIVNAQGMAKMFYWEAPAVEIKEEVITEQPQTIRYDESRYSYLGTVSTDNTPKYMLKDNQLDFIFPISENTAAHGLSITELNQQEQFMLLTDGENNYRVRIK